MTTRTIEVPGKVKGKRKPVALEAKLYKRGKLFAVTRIGKGAPTLTHVASGYRAFTCPTLEYARQAVTHLEQSPLIKRVFQPSDPKTVLALASECALVISGLHRALQAGYPLERVVSEYLLGLE